jgi:hypothetical protein
LCFPCTQPHTGPWTTQLLIAGYVKSSLCTKTWIRTCQYPMLDACLHHPTTLSTPATYCSCLHDLQHLTELNTIIDYLPGGCARAAALINVNNPWLLHAYVTCYGYAQAARWWQSSVTKAKAPLNSRYAEGCAQVGRPTVVTMQTGRVSTIGIAATVAIRERCIAAYQAMRHIHTLVPTYPEAGHLWYPRFYPACYMHVLPCLSHSPFKCREALVGFACPHMRSRSHI